MPSPTETGNKKHIVAERILETDVSNTLCKLFVSNFPDYQVLSVYSELSKKLIAYKIILQNSEQKDAWLETNFAETCEVDFNPIYDLIPNSFRVKSTEQNHLNSQLYAISPEPPKGFKHYTQGLYYFNASKIGDCKVYLFWKDQHLDIVIFNAKTCLFANAFICNSETEMLYYILNAIQLSGNKQDNAQIFLDYNLLQQSSFMDLLQQYFTQIEHLTPPFENPDTEVPQLQELLFSNYLISLCE
jgi:hypothetical protein